MSDEPMQETEQSKTEPPESGAGYDDPDEVRRPLGDAHVPGGSWRYPYPVTPRLTRQPLAGWE